MDPIAQVYLDKYLASLAPEQREKYQRVDSYYFCADEESANLCAELVLQGEKRATAGLLWSYEDEEEPLPEIGQLNVITNWEKIPQCIVETTSVEQMPFNEVSAEFAFEEGEGDKTLDFWRKVHWKFFSAECKELGREPTQEMLVILEKFKMIYQGN